MSRSTKGNIPITDVSLKDIKEILESDSSNLPDSNISMADFFIDHTEGNTNDIYNNFIDETYCEADDGETKKDKLTRTPYNWGHWRNYGGEESDTVPEIYWKSVLDFNNNEKMPQTQEEFDYLNDSNLYPNIPLQAPLSETDVRSLATNNSNRSILNREDYNESIIDKYLELNTKVGIDYPGEYYGKEPEFDIKVTPILGAVASNYYQSSTITKTPLTIPPATALLPIVTQIDLPEIATLLDYFAGPNSPVAIELSGSIAPVLTFVAVCILTIFVVDFLYDLSVPDPEVVLADYQYANMVGDIYTISDILESQYLFGFGNKIFGFDDSLTGLGDQSFTTNVSGSSESYNYRLSDYNYEGTAFSSDNLISEFPTNNAKDKYLNMTFRPKSSQYDLETPPPIINFLVELVPIQNCKLSETKPTAFLVSTGVNQFLEPRYDIVTPETVGRGDTRKIYANTPVTFIGAKWADFIGIKDEKNEGWFTDYNHIAINTDGNYIQCSCEPLYNNKNLGLTQNNITATGWEIFGNYSPASRAATGDYLGYFYQEGESQILRNPYFRLQGNTYSTSGDFDYGLVSLWTHSSDWNISSGAAYVTEAIAGSYLAQSVSLQSGEYYFVDVTCSITSGTLNLLTGTTFATHLYSWYGDKGTGDGPGPRASYTSEELPSGLSYIEDYIQISSSGTYRMLLYALGSSAFLFAASSDFVGNVSTTKLQRLPHESFVSSSRGAGAVSTSSGIKLHWTGSALYEKALDLYLYSFSDNSASFTIDIPEINSETGSYNIQAKWGYDSNRDEVIVDYFDIDGTTVTIDIPSNVDLPYNRSGIVTLIFYVGGSGIIGSQDLVFDSFKSNSYNIKQILDHSGILVGADLDFGDTDIVYTFDQTPFNINSLNLENASNTVAKLGNLINNGSITESITLSGSNVSGDLGNVINIPEIIIDGGAVTYYSGNTQPLTIDNYNIVWKNCDIEVSSLNKLILALDFSASKNGTLDISGDNPEITNETVLEAITNMIDNKRWNINYNSSVTWIYETTLIFDQRSSGPALDFINNGFVNIQQYVSGSVSILTNEGIQITEMLINESLYYYDKTGSDELYGNINRIWLVSENPITEELNGQVSIKINYSGNIISPKYIGGTYNVNIIPGQESGETFSGYYYSLIGSIDNYSDLIKIIIYEDTHYDYGMLECAMYIDFENATYMMPQSITIDGIFCPGEHASPVGAYFSTATGNPFIVGQSSSITLTYADVPML